LDGDVAIVSRVNVPEQIIAHGSTNGDEYMESDEYLSSQLKTVFHIKETLGYLLRDNFVGVFHG